MLRLGDKVRYAAKPSLSGEIVLVSKDGTFFSVTWNNLNGTNTYAYYEAHELIGDPLQEVWDALEQKPILTKVNE